MSIFKFAGALLLISIISISCDLPQITEPYAYGTIDGTGNTVTGSNNFTSSRLNVGLYQISFNTPVTDDDLVVSVTALDTNGYVGTWRTVGGNLEINIRFSVTATGTDIPFSFIVYMP